MGEKAIKTSKIAKKTAESKFKFQSSMRLKTQANVGKMKERSVKGCLGNETSERIAKENEAKPKEKEKKSKQWEINAKELQTKEGKSKGTNMKEKSWKEERNKKLVVRHEKEAKEPLMKHAALMAKLERQNKEKMDKHSKELEFKELQLREDKFKSEAKHKEQIIKKDAHWESFPKAREKERKAKLYKARNAVWTSHQEGVVKKKDQCEKAE